MPKEIENYFYLETKAAPPHCDPRLEEGIYFHVHDLDCCHSDLIGLPRRAPWLYRVDLGGAVPLRKSSVDGAWYPRQGNVRVLQHQMLTWIDLARQDYESVAGFATNQALAWEGI